MRLLLQRVSQARVEVEEKIIGEISNGILAFVGIHPEDNTAILRQMAEKMIGLRIFEDDKGAMNLSLKEVGGQLLLVSQFTLYADCRKGRRPSFSKAAGGDFAKQKYEELIQICESILEEPVAQGKFGADMKVKFCNDGPVTIWLDSNEIISVKK